MEKKDDTTWLLLQETPLDVGAAFAHLQSPEAGGIDLFVGTTRQWTGGRETARLFYESYADMALQEMARLADAAREQWPVARVCILHRLGEVPVAEASVVVGVATPHRADAFAACRFLIDTLKQQVPIWKRERYTDGTTEWIEGPAPPSLSTTPKEADGAAPG